MRYLAVLALALGGCGLISSDVTNFDLTLPDKTFTVDTAQWMLNGVDTFTSVSCASSSSVCADGAKQACKMNQCAATCDAQTKTCDLQVLVGLYQMVDLLNEKPELKSINDQPLVGVHIDKIEYQVTENTLNVDTPELGLYVAPSTVMAVGPEAVQIGTIPPIPHGTTPGVMAITLDADAQAALAKYMGDYKNPFNILVGSTIEVKMNDPVPNGRLTAKVKVTAHAQLGG
ncbi:MAG TPA: hypothetical protein VL463_00900 [Kofleriaceae bacterium]|jgi:hypothetical protein|nr:hypothetical protein [Kofleriaceae bacterium]